MTHHRIECFETCAGLLAGVVLILLSPIGVTIAARGPQDTLSSDSIAARLDPYVDKQRVVVMTDIANEPDDQMSLVRFLVYANQFDIDALIATTSTGCGTRCGPT